MTPNSRTTHIAVCRPKPGSYSETFIRAHLDRLPGCVHDYALNPGRVDGRRLWWTHRPGLHWVTFNLWVLRRDKDEVYRNLLAREFRRRGIDVVLAEYGPTGMRVAAACARAGIPLVVHFHGHDAYSSRTLERYSPGYQQMFDVARAIVVVSEHMRRQLMDLGAPERKLRLNYYGVDTQLLAPAPVASNPPVLLAVGRFVEKKAPHLTISAFAKVHARRPEARLRMAGDGPMLGHCRELVERLRLTGAVRFLGPLDHAAVAGEMGNARAFVQHSMRASNGDSEGTPVAVIEAGAAGLPVVSTRHAGIPDVVIEDETGILVDEGDVEGMAAAMEHVLADPLFAARLGAQGRERVVREFDMDASIGRLASILEEAVASSR